MDAKIIEGCKIQATDGLIGDVHDLLFDDGAWTVRYLVVNTGTWLDRHQVLISPESVTGIDWPDRILEVGLTRQQVKDSPDISSEIPLTRQQEEWLRSYYAWPAYWGGANLGGPLGVPLTPAFGPTVPILPTGLFGEQDEPTPAPSFEAKPAGEPELRSARAIRDYRIDATDGDIGHVEDLLIDDEHWTIHQLAVDTKNWWLGRKVVVSPDQIRTVRWEDRKVLVNLTRDGLKRAPGLHSRRVA